MMRVYILTRWGGKKPGDVERQIALAMVELSIRGGFHENLWAFWSLERLGEVPMDSVAWILGSPEEVQRVCRESGTPFFTQSTLSPSPTGALSITPSDGIHSISTIPSSESLSNPSSSMKRRLFITPRDPFWERPTEHVPVLVDPYISHSSNASSSAPPDTHMGHSRVESIDWTAAFWYLLQRAEEYSPQAPHDAHGRFPSWASVLSREGWLNRPLADEIALYIYGQLSQLGLDSGAKSPESRWHLAVTHDIDSLRYWSWRRLASSLTHPDSHRGGGSVPSIDAQTSRSGLSNPNASSSPPPTAKRRRSKRLAPWRPTIRSSWRPESDPHWSFNWLRRWEREHGVRPTVFVIPERRTRFEPYDLSRPSLSGSLTARLSAQLHSWSQEGAEIGLHPPYDAPEHPERLSRQRQRLEELLGGLPMASMRYHWLRLRIPEGWNAPPQGGLLNDSSLGYSQQEGFRAGTCHPFSPVDLNTGRESGLIEIPLIAMDATLRFHRSLDPRAAREQLHLLSRACRNVGGIFTLLWHTNSFDPYEWKHWRRVFTETVEEALENGAIPVTISEMATRHRTERRKTLERVLPGENEGSIRTE